MHTVIPTVMIVEGVLNEALVTAEEFGKYVDSWNGRPVPILHPEDYGEHVSANRPDILERVAGTIFAARVDGDKLKAELWLDEQRFDELGKSALLAQLKAGETIEVSTGYFADTILEAGEFRGKPYKYVHRNLRPDHLALLPDQVGACSIADGCGAPRVNTGSASMEVGEAVATVLKALGVKSNCSCGVTVMTKDELAKRAEACGLKANLKGDEYEALEKMLGSEPNTVRALVEAFEKTAKDAAKAAKAKSNEDEEPEANEDEDDEPKDLKKNRRTPKGGAQPVTLEAIASLIDNKLSKGIGPMVTEHLKRSEITQRLLANQANVFSADELAAMPITHLEKLEQTMRPVDYSGAGGFRANVGGQQAEPLLIHSGIFSPREKAKGDGADAN